MSRRTTNGAPGIRPWWSAALVDLLAVLAFVTIGRAAHSHGLDLSGLASTAWPFLTGWAVGWLVISRRRAPGSGLRAGGVAWLSIVAVGMVLRAVAGQGVDVAFVRSPWPSSVCSCSAGAPW
jgi:hypothetical protein